MPIGLPRVAIIPARGGSKRIPRKNVRPFAGKPMIHYAIEAARATAMFDRIIVSTDDAAIADVAVRCGAAVPFGRPPALADDHSPTVPVIAHAIQECRALGWAVEDVCCIYPAVPLLRAEDIVAAYDLMIAGGRQRYVFPVASFASPIQRALRRGADGGVAPYFPEFAATRTQDLEQAYYDAGQFYWGEARLWLEGLDIHRNGAAIELPGWRAVDIDVPADWERAEALYRAFARSEA